MPLSLLDYRSMLAHEFIVNNDDKMLLYNLRFNKKHNENIILPAPLLFDLTAVNYLVTLEAVYTHRGQASTPSLSLSRNLHWTLIVHHLTSGIRRRWPASGILITPPTTPGRVAAVLGLRPT